MEQNSKQSPRPWLYGAIFVWALTGAVAFATYSSQPKPSAQLIEDLSENSSVPSPATAVASPPAATQKGAAPTKYLWEPNFEAAMQKAKRENKPILIDFYTDWCSACKQMDAAVYPDKKVIAESANWVSIKINAEKRPDVASAYGVTGYPTIIFAENTGKPMAIIPGYDPSLDFAAYMASVRTKAPKVNL